MRARSIVFVSLLFSFGCVTKSAHERAMSDAARQLQQTKDDDQRSLDAEKAALAQCKKLHDECDQLAHDTADKLTDLSKKYTAALGQLDAATALNKQAAADLASCGKKMKDQTGALSSALAETKAALEEARKAKAAAEARAALFKKLTEKFQKMIDAGSLKIVLRNGRMVLQLANDVLFDSGKVDLKPAGQQALKDVAVVLKTLDGRQLQVAGHTDNVAIQTSRFPSNWELSTARAVNVTRFLVAQGVPPQQLSAAGYGEFDPVAPNDTPENKAKNRRIEITLQPDISEMIALPNQ